MVVCHNPCLRVVPRVYQLFRVTRFVCDNIEWFLSSSFGVLL